MRRYTYNGEPDRYYPALGLTPEPGSRHRLDRNPGDGRWTPPDPDPDPEPVDEQAGTGTPAAAGEPNQEEGSDA